jgi:hypothetical protein
MGKAGDHRDHKHQKWGAGVCRRSKSCRPRQKKIEDIRSRQNWRSRRRGPHGQQRTPPTGKKLSSLTAIELQNVEFCESIKEIDEAAAIGLHVMHPSHVPIVNRVFTPSAEELAYSEGLIQAMEDARKRGSAAVTYRGDMVDEAMVKTAQELIALARSL